MGTVRYTTVNGKVIAEKRSGVRSFYVSDSLGSTVALIDNTQTITDTFEYWPYGEVRSHVGTNTTPLQFVGTLGCHTDSSSKTSMRARTVDTQKGRWMTKDPIGFDGGDWNVYRYTASNPVTSSDPSGLLYSRIPISVYPPVPNCNKYTFPKGPYPRRARTPRNCQGYWNLCKQGYFYGCNAYFACLTLSIRIGRDDKESECVRGCLQITIPFPQIPQTDCNKIFCQHWHCFNACRWKPWTPFTWPLLNDQCCGYFTIPPPVAINNCIRIGPCPSVTYPPILPEPG